MTTRQPDSRHIAIIVSCLIAALLIVVGMFWIGEARAETQLVWSPTSTNRDVGSWQCASDATAVLTGNNYSSSTILTFGELPATANVFQCRADLAIGAGAGCPAPGNYSQEGMQAKSLARLCQAAPPPPDPLPIGPPRRPFSTYVHVAHDKCWIGTSQQGVNPMWTEAQLFGSSAIVRDDGNGLVSCERLGVTQPGQVVLVRVRTGNSGGFSPWSGYWPIVRFNALNGVALDELRYEIVKPQADRFTFDPGDSGEVPLCLVDGASSGLRALYARNGSTRGVRITPDLAVGPTTQNAGTASPFDRVECDCADVFTYSTAVYARVLGRSDGAYVAGCRHTGRH